MMGNVLELDIGKHKKVKPMMKSSRGKWMSSKFLVKTRQVDVTIYGPTKCEVFGME